MKRQIAMLVTGNGLAQGLQLLALVVLARIYSPEDFGILGSIQALATIIAVILTLQTHLLIPLSANAENAVRRLFYTQIVCFVMAIMLLIPSIYLNFGMALTLALSIGIANSFTSFLVYKGSFKKLSYYYVLRAVLIILFQALLYFLSSDNGLVYGAIIGEITSLLYLAYKILYRKIKTHQDYELKLKNILYYLVEKKQFSVYGTIQELVSSSSFYLPLIFFVSIYGEYTGGQYAMANRLVWAPVVLLSSSLSQVYYHQFSQKNNWDVLRRWIWVNPSYIIVAVLILTIYHYLSDVILLILGREWDVAKDMIFYLLISGMLFLLSIPYRVSFRAMEQLKTLLIIDLLFFVIVGFLFISISLDTKDMLQTLIIVSFFQALLIIIFSKNRFAKWKQSDD